MPSELRRHVIPASISEASALLAVDDADLLERIGALRAWWIAHDEANGERLVSIVAEHAEATWSVVPVKLNRLPTSTASVKDVTDAEALARSGPFVLVFGSGFINGKGRLDDRRSFISRFREDEVAVGANGGLSGDADHIDIGPTLRRAMQTALETQGVELLAATGALEEAMIKADEPGALPLNIEGACCLGDELLLGLRWPVHHTGDPLVLRLPGGASRLRSDDAPSAGLDGLGISIEVVATGGTRRRPNGIRGMAADGDTIHVVVGSTERDLIAGKTKRSGFAHVRWHRGGDREGNNDTDRTNADVVRTFEGYRRVEAVAARLDGWIYALDDEDAVVLLTTEAS